MKIINNIQFSPTLLATVILFILNGTSEAQIDPFSPAPLSQTTKKCIYCDEIFSNQAELDEHIASNHTFACPYCNEVFSNQAELGEHIASNHTFACPYCDEVFSNQAELDSHTVEEHRFMSLGDITTDCVTNLQWKVGPDRTTEWSEALDWVADLGEDWRMPTRYELRSLFDAGIRSSNWGNFENNGVWVWSGEAGSSSTAWALSFVNGNESKLPRGVDFESSGPSRVTYHSGRGFAVRTL